MAAQELFIMIKPDGVQRGLVGEITTRFERKGFVLCDMYMVECSEHADKFAELYHEHAGKTYYDRLMETTRSGKSIAMKWRGRVEVARKIVGATVPWEAESGTIRGDLASCLPNNLVHCSDSWDSASRELEIWFKTFE